MTAPYSSAPTPATFGIVSLLGLLSLPIVFTLLAIAGVGAGLFSRRREGGARTLALAGTIISLVGIAVNIASMVIGAILVLQLIG